MTRIHLVRAVVFCRDLVYLTDLVPFPFSFPIRFFRSLAATGVNPHGESGHQSLQLVPSGGDTNEGEKKDEKIESEVVTLNFSLESILQFQNNQLLHRTLSDPAPAKIRKRPNYDNRKRRFMARQPPERRKSLVCP